MDKEKVSFIELVSPYTLNSTSNELHKIKGVDIEQVNNFKSFIDYFQLNILLIFIAFLGLGIKIFSDGFSSLRFNFEFFSFFYCFLLGLATSFRFKLFQKNEDFINDYINIREKRLDKWEQISSRAGKVGLFLYLFICLIPTSILYIITK